MDSTSSMRYQEEQKSSLTSLPSPKTQSNGHNHSHNQIPSPRPISLPSPKTQTQSNGHNHNQIPSPRPITRSEPGNPYPTTFVQADTTSFKQVVQMLTGSSETAKQASTSTKPNHNHNHNIPPKKQQGFKLYERRNSFHKNLNINPLLPPIFPNSTFSPRNKQEILSPSILDFPSLVLSPVTPLIPDPFNRSGSSSSSSSAARNVSSLDSLAEDKAIREKGFFLHPSPRAASTSRDSEPRLLPLFPTSSPRASGPSSSSKYSAS